MTPSASSPRPRVPMGPVRNPGPGPRSAGSAAARLAALPGPRREGAGRPGRERIWPNAAEGRSAHTVRRRYARSCQTGYECRLAPAARPVSCRPNARPPGGPWKGAPAPGAGTGSERSRRGPTAWSSRVLCRLPGPASRPAQSAGGRSGKGARCSRARRHETSDGCDHRPAGHNQMSEPHARSFTSGAVPVPQWLHLFRNSDALPFQDGSSASRSCRCAAPASRRSRRSGARGWMRTRSGSACAAGGRRPRPGRVEPRGGRALPRRRGPPAAAGGARRRRLIQLRTIQRAYARQRRAAIPCLSPPR